MIKSDRDILRFHVEAVWGVKLPSITQNEVALLAESTRPDWRLYIADLAGERVLIWRAGLASAEKEELRARLHEVQRLPEGSPLPPDVSREVALRLTASPAIELTRARRIVRLLTVDDYALIEAFWPGEARRILLPATSPLLGAVVDGRLLSVAHSSRRTAEACELGIDTLPEARRQGYALAATIAWSAAIAEEGLTPIYSALAENTASLGLARAAGYREFARGITLS